MVWGLVRGRGVRRHREADQGQGGDEHPHRHVDREKAQLVGVRVEQGALDGGTDEQVQQDQGGQQPVQDNKGQGDSLWAWLAALLRVGRSSAMAGHGKRYPNCGVSVNFDICCVAEIIAFGRKWA